MSETLRRPLALLLLAACPLIAGAGLRACAAPHAAAAAVVAVGTQAGPSQLPAPLCAGCWG
ncbi:hypothetical protein [Actinospica robiniae]|uniref:hypothetical protein n=1 Tax=Actinospica robiniae TaxID=304901 RepID=UPI0005562D37|nr:hypothetical protein [Actinospica robiniae]